MNIRTPIARGLTALAITLGLAVAPAAAQVRNGSFENGLEHWIVQDLGAPFWSLGVQPAGMSAWPGFFTTEPTRGDFVLYHGFDGDGPGTILVAQDLTVPKDRTMLLFDTRAAWDLVNWGASLDRWFHVLVEPVGGGEPLATFDILRAVAGTFEADTGDVTSAVDLSEFEGMDVRLVFAWTVPEDYVGPAAYQLDHVRLEGRKPDVWNRLKFRARFRMGQPGRDALNLRMTVPVEPGWAPAGQTVVVEVGDVDRTFVLDAKGRGETFDAKLRLRELKKEPGALDLRMALRKGDLEDLRKGHGMGDRTTAKGGETASIPVRVQVDGLWTERQVMVVYRAKENVRGVAKGAQAGELKRARLGIALNFAQPDRDRLALRAFALPHAGFLPDGEEVTVRIGSYEETFVLDGKGKGDVDRARIRLRRQKRDPATCNVTLVCKKASLAEVFAQDGLVDADVFPPGDTPFLPVTVTIGDRTAQAVLPIEYVAKAGKKGVARGRF